VFDFQQRLEDVEENSDSASGSKEKHLSWPSSIDNEKNMTAGLDPSADAGLFLPGSSSRPGYLKPCLSPRYFPPPMSPLARADLEKQGGTVVNKGVTRSGSGSSLSLVTALAVGGPEVVMKSLDEQKNDRQKVAGEPKDDENTLL
jgi:hypothetical protein